MASENTQTAAPGVAVEVARLMALINDYVGDRVGLETIPGHAELEAFERASDRVSTKESELESALRTALLAGAAGGGEMREALEKIDKANPPYTGEWTLEATLSDFCGNADDYVRERHLMIVARTGDIARVALKAIGDKND